MSTLRAWDLNNTRKADMELVFFNRVPKVGSQTFMTLIRRLSAENASLSTVTPCSASKPSGCHRISSWSWPIWCRNCQHPSVYVKHVCYTNFTRFGLPHQSTVYVKHVCYTNFTRFGLPTPIYVNLVRDPVERVISWYYYIRAPWYYVERKQAFPDLPLPDPRWLRKDFETCVLNHDPECTFNYGETHEGIGDHRRQTLFFCGHDEECTPFNTVGALERAKYAVESQYSVVGVLEDLNTTLSVFEAYIPRFFRGAKNIYWEEVNNFNKINRNSFKPPVSEEVKDIVRRNFTREIEFYQFCKQRLHKQFLAAKLPLN
uniref:Putative heparan sulfate 2-o-sulfotransferase pipe n=1 Tax=Lutzomyia longipalpis TaxID=7200 RepID=A0A1B0CBD4_LUTLO